MAATRPIAAQPVRALKLKEAFCGLGSELVGLHVKGEGESFAVLGIS